LQAYLIGVVLRLMKILHSADWHINLDKKKVPVKWQINRFQMFFNEMLKLEKTCDIHILSGDIFDKKPILEESSLFASYANKVQIRTIIIPGNHEATKKGESFLDTYLEHEGSINNPNIEIYTRNTRIEHDGVWFQLFPYCDMQKDRLPSYVDGDILVTHIRGEVPPHIVPEYEFEKLRPWHLILLGDLHFQHQYKDFPAFYPGSPMNVIFDRDDSRIYGVQTIDVSIKSKQFNVDIVPLALPKLIRKQISVGEQLIKDDFHHVVYEVTGSIDELSGIENSELLDKKIAHMPEEASKLDLTNAKNILEELSIYLDYIEVANKDEIMKEFVDLNVTA